MGYKSRLHVMATFEMTEPEHKHRKRMFLLTSQKETVKWMMSKPHEVLTGRRGAG